MSASLVDGGYQAGRNFQVPHRRPVPPVSGVPQRMQPLTRIVPDHQYDGTPQQSQGHMHSRTVSSIAMPAALVSQPHQPQQYQTAQPQYQNYTNPQMQQQSTRRTLSNGTASTSSTSNAPIRKNSGSTNLQRTASSLSGGSTNSPTSYVALMRKQKATVWCDRAQVSPYINSYFKLTHKSAARRPTPHRPAKSRPSSRSNGSLPVQFQRRPYT